MRQFKTVFKFEYLNHLKSKSFIIATLFFMVLIAILANIPHIAGLFSSIFGSGESDTPDSMSAAAYYDSQGAYTPEILSAFQPSYTWEELGSTSDAEALVEDGTYELTVSIDGLTADIYQNGADAFSTDLTWLSEMITTVSQASAMSQAGMTEAEISGILSVEPELNVTSVGRDVSQSFWLSYALLFMLYFTIIMYGQSVTVSVVTEKSSKAMELLISSAKPLALMFGKVIGTGLAGLTQFLAIMGTAVVFISINLTAWEEFFPMISYILELSLAANLFVYAIVFFLLGFFSFAFMYAAAASTVSRMEDASSAQLFPMLLFIAAFMVAMLGLSAPDALYIKVCSFVPFLSPLIMFMRICTVGVPTYEILTSIGLNIIYIFLAGLLSAKIYKIGVMLYGNKPKVTAIAKLLLRSGNR